MSTRSIARHSAALAVLGFVTVGSAQAATYTFNDPGWVSGSVNTSTGEIILSALAANPTSVAQTVSGIEITFTTIPGATSLTSQVSTNGLLDSFDIENPGAVRTVTQAAGIPTNWVLGVVGAVATLSANNSCGGSPCDFIVGPSPYTNFNASIETHSPFIDLQGKFIISGITDLLISSIVVQFGSTPDERNQTFSCLNCAPPPPGETPIPGALPLFTSGMGVLGFLGWRRKRRLARRAA
jgi:hypothetical protein